MSLKKYEDAVEPRLLEVQAWARCSMTEKAMAKKLGIAYSTFRNYKKQHLALLGTLRESKAIVDIKVENAMLKRALGYKVVDVVSERVYNKDTKEYEVVVTKETTKDISPDVGAATFWLKNRKSKDWKEKVEEELY
ncbi:transposase [Clostridium sp.]|uniref:transposase n=1 Tax=Clostridium sp. TaxID=1506 RepID=UPI003FD6E84E